MPEINTLLKLLSEYEVRIPIIQRDYAQGRKNEKANEVRKNLIRDIKNCLDDEERSIDFNFVYGTVNDNIFYPVDGQQRLTTLYLMHWYLNCNQDTDNMSGLKNFSYMTRNSASEFFSLLKFPNNNLKAIARESQEFRKDIENQSWFQVEWGYDPTVDAALNVLDDLSKSMDFKSNGTQYFNRLKNGAITFSHITETGENAENNAAKSYIRMNARGKALEPFENLKAMLDSIDGKLDNSIGFVGKYDNKYIDTMFNQYDSMKSLGEKTKLINEKSLNILKNIFNLCRQIKAKETVPNESTFISSIYACSQEISNDIDKGFFKMYFNMIVAVLDFYCNNQDDKNISDVFLDKLSFRSTENRHCVSAILYIYYFNIAKQSILNEEVLSEFIYVLTNLNYANWNENTFLYSINCFAKETSKFKDIFDYFCTTDLSLIQNNMANVLNDIKVRVKEQKIKATIIAKNNSLAWNYFSKLEQESSFRKIQYLLYISGYWMGNGEFTKLKTYIEIAYKYFYKDELNWCKIYATATNMDENNELLCAKDINENCGTKHIWSNEFYDWNDEQDKNLFTNKMQLETIKKAYDNLDGIITIIETMLSNKDYNECWLRYAIKYGSIEFLNRSLRWDSKQNIVTISDGNKRYDMYIMNIVNKFGYGLKDLNAYADSENVFENNANYGSFSTGNRCFIMRLQVSIPITNINENYHKNICLYSYDNTSHLYTIYEVTSPYKFNKIEFLLSNGVNQQQIKKTEIEKLLDSYEESDYIKIKESDSAYPFQKDKTRNSFWLGESNPIVYTDNPKISDHSLL